MTLAQVATSDAPTADACMRASALDAFVTQAKGLVTLDDVKWDDADWDVTLWCANRRHRTLWHFTAEDGIPFDPAFTDVIKAACVYQVRRDKRTPRHATRWIYAVRMLYATVAVINDGHFRWADVVLGDWVRTEQAIDNLAVGDEYKYLLVSMLQHIAHILEDRGIIRPTGYQHNRPCPRWLGRGHLDDRDKELAKLPAQEALDALADAAQHPRNDADCLLFVLIKLLAALGFRVGEAVGLQVDCFHVDKETGRAYLTYRAEKGGPLVPKWIPSAALALVHDAVETARALTEPARQRACVLESDRTRVPLLVSHAPDALLTTIDLAEALGFHHKDVAVRYLRKLGLVPTVRGGGPNPSLWKVRDLEKALTKAMPAHMYAILLPTGETQPLSQSLFVVPIKFFRSTPSLLTVEPVSATTVQAFVAGRRNPGPKPHQSVFERYGLRDENGHFWRVPTHRFRHWLNTWAYVGGLSELELARWMGRKDIRQNRAYEHLTAAELVARAKQAVRDKEIMGPITEIYHRLPPAERESFLDIHISAIQVTPYGMCVHNWSAKPCEYNMQCLMGCGEFLREKGNQPQIIAITDIKRNAVRVLRDAESAVQAGQPEAINWVEANRRLIEGADRALEIEDDADHADGDSITVFPGKPSLADRGAASV